MRYGGIVGVIVLIWLLIGAVAVWQRGYFKGQETSCASLGTVAVTVLAGPLNYAGVNPKVNCQLPQPSSMAPIGIGKQIELEAS
jgi:membrane protein YdbS with pleckstrin-like domain